MTITDALRQLRAMLDDHGDLDLATMTPDEDDENVCYFDYNREWAVLEIPGKKGRKKVCALAPIEEPDPKPHLRLIQ